MRSKKHTTETQKRLLFSSLNTEKVPHVPGNSEKNIYIKIHPPTLSKKNQGASRRLQGKSSHSL